MNSLQIQGCFVSAIVLFFGLGMTFAPVQLDAHVAGPLCRLLNLENLDVYHPSIRVIGILTLVVGFYYVRAIVKNDTQFLKATAYGRMIYGILSIYFAYNKQIPNSVAMFGVTDLVSAIITLSTPLPRHKRA